MNLVPVTDFNAPELDVYARLNTVIDVFVHMNKRTAVTRTAPSQG